MQIGVGIVVIKLNTIPAGLQNIIYTIVYKLPQNQTLIIEAPSQIQKTQRLGQSALQPLIKKGLKVSRVRDGHQPNPCGKGLSGFRV